MKLNKKEQNLVDNLYIGAESEKVTNPFSGRTVTLEPLGVALYDYIKGCEISGYYEDFDTARHLFAKYYPEEYMILLD